jgi:6-phosphofructokinase 1
MYRNKIVRRPLVDAVAQTKEVAVAIKNKDFEKAMHLRDAEFLEYYKCYQITTANDKPELMLPPEKRMRVGIIHVGAPAGKSPHLFMTMTFAHSVYIILTFPRRHECR